MRSHRMGSVESLKIVKMTARMTKAMTNPSQSLELKERLVGLDPLIVPQSARVREYSWKCGPPNVFAVSAVI